MNKPAPHPEPQAPAAPSRARAALLKRLADVVCLPSSRVNTFERSMTADPVWTDANRLVGTGPASVTA